MEIRIGDRNFEAPDSCPIDAPQRRRLVRHLRDHGPESLLTSKTLAPYSQCIFNEILEAGGKSVEREEETAKVERNRDQPSGQNASIHT